MSVLTLKEEIKDLKKKLERIEERLKENEKEKEEEHKKIMTNRMKALKGLRKLSKKIPGFDSVEAIRKLRGPI